jgi:cytochrome c553
VRGLPRCPGHLGHPRHAAHRQDETYLRESILKYRSGERAHAPMKAAVGSLSDPVVADLARYYASLPRDGGAAGATR